MISSAKKKQVDTQGYVITVIGILSLSINEVILFYTGVFALQKETPYSNCPRLSSFFYKLDYTESNPGLSTGNFPNHTVFTNTSFSSTCPVVFGGAFSPCAERRSMELTPHSRIIAEA
jgi:hypothetical protein